MANEPISREEHNEFVKRIEDRLENLENAVHEISAISNNVERLATVMDGVLRQMETQNSRLKALEGRDGENWRKVIAAVISAVIGVVVGLCFHIS